jgi:hypothetical protein
MTLHVFTSAAVNYLPKVRALCRSIREHHPEAVIHLALADERPGWLDTKGEPFDDVIDASAIGIPDWRRWTFKHDIVELSTAIKPFVFRHLLERGAGVVLYFDPDMVLFSRVDDILARLADANIALTPHQSKPERDHEAVIDNEIGSLKWGIFNLGFIGVRDTPESRRFLDWWAERTYHFCRADVAAGLFTDQKWLDFAPVFFDGVAILREARHNVATWNLTTRHMAGNLATGFTVDGAPLGFYHFTGFDSGAHHVMAGKNASGNASVQELIAWYERETVAAPNDPVKVSPWSYGRFSDGRDVEPRHRWIYRDRPDLQQAFPDPYDNTSAGLTFHGWCASEGRLRFPALFDSAEPRPQDVRERRPGIARGAFFRMLALLFAPRAGRELRARVARLVRREGIGGVARRLRSTPAPSGER